MEHTIDFVLRENVLTDNLLILTEEGYLFKGGYIAIIKEYSFQNAWSDREEIKRFRKPKSLFNYLEKNYPDMPDYDLSGYNTQLKTLES